MTGRLALPVDGAVGEILAALDRGRTVVLDAPPGTGKTTRVPPALLDASWLGSRRIVMLEPRRVAARAAAERIAAERRERVGETVGLRTRFDTRVGRDTRIEVVTEGVLTRMLLDDPGLAGVGAVIFDEFHERSIHADTGMAFARETAAVLRDDLRLLVMSATFDATTLADRLRADDVVIVQGDVYPVETRYRPPEPGRTPEEELPDAVIDALETYEGDLLAFLAGAGDVNRAARALKGRLGDDVAVYPLHGSLPPGEQDKALRRDPHGRRKVILSTPIAETSVTIDGVRIVVDTGRRRRPAIDVGRGMSGLRTVSASRSATDQRRGRAGRQAPGLCIRLWPEVDQQRRRADEPPEILTADLTALAVHLAAWGVSDATELPWIDAPPDSSLAAARGLLTALGVLDDTRRLTEHGRRLASIAAEPRLAHLMLAGADRGHAATACDVAALLADRDVFRGRDLPIDLRARVDALRTGHPRADRGGLERARELSRRWRRDFGADDEPAEVEMVGPLVSLAFPDRIAQRRSNVGSFLLASGAGVSAPIEDALSREGWLAVAEIDGVGGDARIVTGAPLTRDEIETLHPDRIETGVRGGWDRRARDAVFEEQERLGALVLRRETVANPDREAVAEALIAGVRREGLDLLGWTVTDERLRSRLEFLHRIDPESWPAFDDRSLLQELEAWLAPALGNARRRADLAQIDVGAALLGRLDWRRQRDVDRLAPTHIEVPSGSRIPVDYEPESGPVLAVRLQEMFGLTETPSVAGGRTPLVIHLLSPAHRPVQVTSDLASFWADGYADVRRELRGRYPKHPWPEDPTTAPPTARAKRRK